MIVDGVQYFPISVQCMGGNAIIYYVGEGTDINTLIEKLSHDEDWTPNFFTFINMQGITDYSTVLKENDAVVFLPKQNEQNIPNKSGNFKHII